MNLFGNHKKFARAAALLLTLLLTFSAASAPIEAQRQAAGTPVAFSVGSVSLSEYRGASGAAAAWTDSQVKAIQRIANNSATEALKRLGLAKGAAATPPAAGYAFVDQKSGYGALTTDSERLLYELIDTGAYQVADAQVQGYYPVGQIEIPQVLTRGQIQAAFMAYTNDNPQVFWLSNVFSYGYDGIGTVLQLYSYLSDTGCNAAIQTFDAKVQSVVQSIPVGLNEFDREDALYDYIVKTCSYNNAAAQDTSIWQAFTAYGALTDGSVVCEGYSRVMELLASYTGLRCALIRGSSAGVGHMWDSVNIDGNWYNLDLTWSDGNQPIYNYFNITNQEIAQTRSVAPAASTMNDQQLAAANSQVNLFMPAATATAENYYAVKGIKIKDLTGTNDAAIVQQLAARLQAGETTIAFSIDAGSNYDAVVNGLVKASPPKMAAYLQQASQLAGKTVRQASYVVDALNHGLEVCVTY